MKVVILWSHISGYMAASWRQLAAVPGVEVFLVAFKSEGDAPFDFGLLGGIPYRMLEKHERQDVAMVTAMVREQKPDSILVSGWAHKAYRAVVKDPAHAAATKIMTMDTQLRLDWRQAIGRHVIRGYLGHLHRIAVAGERSALCAKYFGFTGAQIKLGFCGIDFATFGPLLEKRAAGPWPRKFMYVGRYAPEKDLDTLLAGYQQYRAAAGDDAWELMCCGAGPEKHKVHGPGVIDMGFVPPDRQAEVFLQAGAFVMASRYEPWGVAIAEGACAGLPLVCSDACGAAGDVLRDSYNGYLFGTGDPLSLARTLTKITKADLPTWGSRSRTYGAAFDAAIWPARVFDGLLPGD